MQQCTGHIRTNVLAYLMLVIMVMLLANKVIFIHSHKTIEGKIITHYHPYDKSGDKMPFKSHSHTNTELVFLENLKIFSPSLLLFIVFYNLYKKVKYAVSKINKLPRLLLIINRYRAPPVL